MSVAILLLVLMSKNDPNSDIIFRMWRNFIYWLDFNICCKFMNNYISCVIGLTIANFAWQYFTKQDYLLSCDHSYYQAVAIMILAWLNRSDQKRKNNP